MNKDEAGNPPQETQSSGIAKKKVPSIDALLRARRSLTSLVSKHLKSPFDIAFKGVESGDVEAVIRARRKFDKVGNRHPYQFKPDIYSSESGTQNIAEPD